MPRVTYDAASPYFDTTQTSWYLLPITLRNIPSDSTDQSITSLDARYQNRPDLLSYDLYGSPSYWWVFMVRNMNIIRDPIWDFQAGIAFNYPTSARLKQLLG